jgi:hypothetical protein
MKRDNFILKKHEHGLASFLASVIIFNTLSYNCGRVCHENSLDFLKSGIPPVMRTVDPEMSLSKRKGDQ